MTTIHLFTRLCVYCGSGAGRKPVYEEAAVALGHEMARRGIGLVYGGGNLGLMGAIARSVDEAGGDVHGVIPAPLSPKEISGEPVGTLEVVDSMHARKARMAELSDGFIAMPGGFGTLEELFETITWLQLGIHKKPIGLLNVNGFYDPLVEMVGHHIDEQFIREKYRSLLVIESDPVALLDKLSVHESPDGVIRWITPEQA